MVWTPPRPVVDRFLDSVTRPSCCIRKAFAVIVREYRVEVARRNTAYNQPSYPGFYLASDTDWSKVPLPR